MSISKIKNILFFSLMILLMIAVSAYTYKITNESLEKRAFDIRTKVVLLEFNDLISKNYEDLLFIKTVYLFGNFTNIKNSNFSIDSNFCTNLNKNFEQIIISTIEKRTKLTNKEKEDFFKKVKLLRMKCSHLYNQNHSRKADILKL